MARKPRFGALERCRLTDRVIVGLKIDYLDIGAYSLVAQQNSYRLFKGMKLIYELDEDRGQEEPLVSLKNFSM